MNEKNKIRCAMLFELGICIVMLGSFVYETSKLFQFFDLFIAMSSCCFMFENRRKLLRVDLDVE